MCLLDAVRALDELAIGHRPDRATLLSGALALNTIIHRGQVDRDIRDAAAGLESMATGGCLELDAIGRQRAAVLALAVRRLAVSSDAGRTTTEPDHDLSSLRQDAGAASLNTVALSLRLTMDQAWALAQFLKRVGLDDYRSLAVDQDEAWLMLDAGERVRSALREVGIAPR
jgi:hypothetical protein